MQSEETKTKAISVEAPAEACGTDITLVPEQDTVALFAALFKGRANAYGTENGSCVHRPPNFKRHLSGTCLMGVYPLLDDGTVHFGAVDVDKKDAPDQGRGRRGARRTFRRSRAGFRAVCRPRGARQGSWSGRPRK